jgi:hypothetical protein
LKNSLKFSWGSCSVKKWFGDPNRFGLLGNGAVAGELAGRGEVRAGASVVKTDDCPSKAIRLKW